MWKSAIRTVKKEQFFGIHYEDQFDNIRPIRSSSQCLYGYLHQCHSKSKISYHSGLEGSCPVKIDCLLALFPWNFQRWCYVMDKSFRMNVVEFVHMKKLHEILRVKVRWYVCIWNQSFRNDWFTIFEVLTSWMNLSCSSKDITFGMPLFQNWAIYLNFQKFTNELDMKLNTICEMNTWSTATMSVYNFEIDGVKWIES